MAGVDLPNDITIRGRDITPLLRGKKIEWNNDLYVEYSMKHGATTHMRAWRTENWKYLIDFASPGREELYDLVGDPEENINLAKSEEPQHVRMRKELGEKIRDRMKDLGDPAIAK